jgi:TniQ
MSDEYVPGCFRNLTCFAGESFAGYLLRLAEANGYAGIGGFLLAAGLPISRKLQGDLLNVRANGSQLARLARMAVGQADHLTGFQIELFRASSLSADNSVDAAWIDECRVSRDALMSDIASICGPCLAENGFAREEWDLGPITVCTRHQIMLRDRCSACAAPITWKRHFLTACDACGGDLRQWGGEKVGSLVCEAASDFEALAPFRILDADGMEHVIRWDEMFLVFKSLLVPDEKRVLRLWPDVLVSNASCKARHLAFDRLASTLSSRRYRLADLASLPRRALAPLQAIPRPRIVERQSLRYLEADAGLSRPVAVALSGAPDIVAPPMAAELYGGRPPCIRSYAELATFLGISPETVDRLVSMHVVNQPSPTDLGYDADSVLEARRFLQEGLLTLDELRSVVGVEVEAHDLGDAGLLPRWNPRDKSDSRVRVDLVLDLQARLAEQWHNGGARFDGEPLLALAAKSTRPFRTIAATVELILSRTVALAGWSNPFTWGALRVDSAAFALIDGRVSPPPLNWTPRMGDGRRRGTHRAISRQPPAASCAGRSEERSAGAGSWDCGAGRAIRCRDTSPCSRSGNRADRHEKTGPCSGSVVL